MSEKGSDEMGLEKFKNREVVKEERRNLAIHHPSEVMVELNRVAESETFRLFASKLFGRLDEMNETLKEQSSTLDVHTEKLELQSKQISKMNEAFDMIMRDYFDDVTNSIKDYGNYITQQSRKNEEALIAEATPDMIRVKLDILRDKVSLVDEKTVILSNPKMQEVYNEMMPVIKKELNIMSNSLYDKINTDLHSMTFELAKTTGEIGKWIREDIADSNNKLNQHALSLINKMNSSEKSIKMSLGNSKNVHRV